LFQLPLRCRATQRVSRAFGSAGGESLRLASCPRSASFLVRCAVESSFAGGVECPSKETGAVSFTARGVERPPLAGRGEGAALSTSKRELGVAIGTLRFGVGRGQTLALSGSQ
jgi:hypothetical protein